MLKLAITLVTATIVAANCAAAEPRGEPRTKPDSEPEPKLWLRYPGKEGKPAAGKRVVLIVGEQEYRSEESLPMLAHLLSERHGFDCTVLFSINPKTGFYDPSVLDNVPGLHALKDADLLILNVADYREISWYFGVNLVSLSMRRGDVVYRESQVQWPAA